MAEYSLGEAQLGTSVDLSGLKKGIDQGQADASQGFGKIGDIVGGVLKVGVAAAATAVVAAGAIVAGGIADAREAVQIMAQTEAVIKSTGSAAGKSATEVADLAASLSAASGKSLFGDDDIQKSENLLLTFTNIKGEVFDAATAISVDMAQALGGLPADQAVALGKALNDPIQGITALTRVGVTFTDQQKEQIKAMQEAGDMAGAQKIILEELNKEFGGSAEAAAKADGGWAQFKDRLGEAQETIGAALLPILGELAGLLNDQIVPVIETAAAAFSAWLADPAVQEGIRSTADAIMTGLGVAFDFIANTAIPALVGAWGTIEPVVTAAIGLFAGGELSGALNQTGVDFQAIATTIQGVMDGILAVVSAVLAQISAFWAAHGAEITAFAQQAWSQIADIINTGVQLYQSIVPPVLQAIAGFIQAHGAEIQAIFSGVWQAISALISGVLGTIQGILHAALAVLQGDWSGAWTAIQGVAQTQLNAIQGVITGILNAIAGIFGTTLAEIGSNWSNKWNEFVGTVETTKNNIISTLESMPGQALQIGIDIVQGIIDGAQSMAGRLISYFIGLAQQALQAAMDIFDIGSPSRAFAYIGQMAILGILEGMNELLPELLNAIIGAGEDIEREVQRIADAVRENLADAFDATASIERNRAKMLDAVGDMSGDVRAEVERRMAEVEAETAKIQDPEEAKKYYAMRTSQILELAKLQEKASADLTDDERHRTENELANIQAIMDQTDLTADEKARLEEQAAALQEKLNGDLTEDERKRLDAQMDAIRKAQAAELEAFKVRQEGLSQTEKLAQMIADLQESLSSEAADIEHKLQDRHLSDEDRQKLQARLEQIRAAQAALFPIATAASGLPSPGGGPVIPPPAPMPPGGTPFAGPGGDAVLRIIVDEAGLKKLFKVEIDKIGRFAEARRRSGGL